MPRTPVSDRLPRQLSEVASGQCGLCQRVQAVRQAYALQKVGRAGALLRAVVPVEEWRGLTATGHTSVAERRAERLVIDCNDH